MLLSVDDVNEKVGYLRSCAIGELERACVHTFVEHEQEILDGTFKGSLVKNLEPRIRDAYTHCAEVSVARIYKSKDVVDIELAGYRIISQLIELFTDAVMFPFRRAIM